MAPTSGNSGPVTWQASKRLLLLATVSLPLLLVTASVIAYAHWPFPASPAGIKADRVIVEKGKRKLKLVKGNAILREYQIALGGNPVGPKELEGDGKTPEGIYTIDYRNPHSQYHLSLHISYPKREDVARAKKTGGEPGGMIMIHGLPNGMWIMGRLHHLVDWTNGCIAVTNREMDEIWRTVPDGTVSELRP